MGKFFYKRMEFYTPDDVYQPREDSLLLAEVLEKETLEGKTVLDVGTGSGLLAAIAASSGAIVSAVDISERAVEVAKKNFELNKVQVRCVKSNMFEKVLSSFDLIIFNAPYLPEEVKADNKAWAAGDDLVIIRNFIDMAKEHLKKNGKVLLLVSTATGLEKVYEMLNKNKYEFQIVAGQKIPWENLVVIECRPM